MIFRATIGDLKKGINAAIKGGISEGAVIVWADQANDGDKYCEELGVPNGTLLFGIEEMKDGEKKCGTLQIQPSRISDILN